jgi:hypothetical protein
MIVCTNSNDPNQDEADGLQSQRRTTATTVAIVREESDRSHPVASISIDTTSIDRSGPIRLHQVHPVITHEVPIRVNPMHSVITHEELIRLHPVHPVIAHEDSIRLHPVHYATDQEKSIRLHPVHPAITHSVGYYYITSPIITIGCVTEPTIQGPTARIV